MTDKLLTTAQIKRAKSIFPKLSPLQQITLETNLPIGELIESLKNIETMIIEKNGKNAVVVCDMEWDTCRFYVEFRLNETDEDWEKRITHHYIRHLQIEKENKKKNELNDIKEYKRLKKKFEND